MPTRGRPSTLPEPWRTLAARAGGVEKLARRFDVDPRVVRYWAHGQSNMAGPSKTLLKMLIVEYGLEDAAWKQWLGKE